MNRYKSVKMTEAMMKTIGVDTVYLQACQGPHCVRGATEEGKYFTLQINNTNCI